MKTMLDCIAPNRIHYSHPLTRRDEADISALINAFLCGNPIDRIGEWNDRGSKTVTSDEALTGDVYRTRFETEIVRR